MRRSIIVAVCALLWGAPSAWAGGEWRWPVRGSVASVFENDEARPYAGGMHRGIDIAADVGTPVVAARSGTVTYAGALGAAGNVVAVRDARYATSYLHLASVSVSRGEQIGMGSPVGVVGITGRRSVSEPHLHFGVRLADRYVDPLSLLPELRSARAVPAGPVVRRENRLVRHPAVAPAGARVRVAAPDRGRPLIWGGVVLLALVLFGGAIARLNAAVNLFGWRASRRALRSPSPACPSRPGSLAPP